MVTEPADLAVTTPEVETVATEVLLDDHVTVLFVALLGETVAVKLAVFPSSKDRDVLSKETPVTDTVAVATVTEQVAFFEPSCVVQVIVAEPADLAVTTPEVETVATEVLLDDHVTVLFVALLGETVAVKLAVFPSSKDRDVLSKETPVTDTVAVATVTEQVAFFEPSCVVQVIVAEPAALAVTVPSEATVATEVLLEDQETAVFVALLGETDADSFDVCPVVKDNDVGETEIPVTEIVAALTVTAQVAFFEPSCVVQVMVAEPAALAVTVPSEATVATEVLLEDQETAVFVALLGETDADSFDVCPVVKDNDAGETEIPVTDIVAAVTVTAQVAVLLPSDVFTIIVVDPTAFAVTTPLVETVATEVLLDDQDTPVLVALVGLMVALSVPDDPTTRPIDDRSSETPVTEIVAALTVTAQVAFFPPSCEVQVIEAVPTDFAVTTPEEETVATEVLLDAHTTAVFVALDGVILAVNTPVEPT